MYRTIGGDFKALEAAAKSCGLFISGRKGRFLFDRLTSQDCPPRWLSLSSELSPDDADEILTVTEDRAAKCSRAPHEVGVYYAGSNHIELVFDPYKDGFGLMAYIGEDGDNLVRSYFIHACLRLTVLLSYALDSRVDVSETTHIEMRDPMSQAKIKVRISPKGETQFKVEGVLGNACTNLTAAVEKALGTVTADQPTAEMFKTQEQTIQAEN